MRILLCFPQKSENATTVLSQGQSGFKKVSDNPSIFLLLFLGHTWLMALCSMALCSEIAHGRPNGSYWMLDNQSWVNPCKANVFPVVLLSIWPLFKFFNQTPLVQVMLLKYSMYLLMLWLDGVEVGCSQGLITALARGTQGHIHPWGSHPVLGQPGVCSSPLNFVPAFLETL